MLGLRCSVSGLTLWARLSSETRAGASAPAAALIEALAGIDIVALVL